MCYNLENAIDNDYQLHLNCKENIMEKALMDFQLLSNIRLYFYPDSNLKNKLHYGFKTNDRLISDMKNIFDKNSKNSSFTIQAIYPQCYVIVWPNFKINNKPVLVFSEIFHIMEYNSSHQVICCEKCNRLIDTTIFKQTSHEFLKIAGEQLIKISNNDNQHIKFNYSARIINENHSCNNICKNTIFEEIHRNYGSHDIISAIKEISSLIATGNFDSAKKNYYHILNQLKTDFDELPPHKSIQGKFSYIMTALTYEISEIIPDIKENLFQLHKVALSEFLKKNHYSNQIIFAQDFLDVYIKLIAPTNNENTSYSIQKVLQIIHKDYSKNLKLKDIASKINIQKNYLSRQFKKEVGKDFTNYLMEYRLKRAVLLMKETSHHLTEIAMSVGFDSSTYFSTCFKKLYSVSPSEYRKKCIR